MVPLNMSHSTVSIDELLQEENRAIGYSTNEKKTNEKTDYYRIAGMRAAGSINSNVTDMAQWLITWINGGNYFDKQIVPARYVKEAISSQMTVNGAMPDKEMPDVYFANYGYGWFLTSYKGHYHIEHGGNIDGFSALVSFFPTDSLGIVVLANQNASAIPNIVSNTISDKLLNVSKTDWLKRYLEAKEKQEKAVAESKKTDASRVKNTRPSHNLVEYAGSYNLDGYGKFTVDIENDSLFAHFKRIKTWLKHYHYDVFTPHEVKANKVDTTDTFVNQFKFNFKTNLAGDISGVEIFLEPALTTPMFFKRTPKIIKVDKALMEAYAGEYQIGGMIIKVHVKDGILYAFVPGQTDYELLATDKHKFNIKVLDGYKIEFLEDDDGAINAVNFIQPNGTFKATRKKPE